MNTQRSFGTHWFASAVPVRSKSEMHHVWKWCSYKHGNHDLLLFQEKFQNVKGIIVCISRFPTQNPKCLVFLEQIRNKLWFSIVPPSSNCAEVKNKYVFDWNISHQKKTLPLVCRHSNCKGRKHLGALSSFLVIKMFCWSFMLKTSQSSRKKLCSQILLAKELGCLLTLTFSEGATCKCTSSAISRGILEWACFVQNSSSASDSIELVSSLIPLPAVSGRRFSQDSGYLAGNIFWSTCCGSRPWHSWGRKLQHALLGVSVTFTTSLLRAKALQPRRGHFAPRRGAACHLNWFPGPRQPRCQQAPDDESCGNAGFHPFNRQTKNKCFGFKFTNTPNKFQGIFSTTLRLMKGYVIAFPMMRPVRTMSSHIVDNMVWNQVQDRSWTQTNTIIWTWYVLFGPYEGNFHHFLFINVSNTLCTLRRRAAQDIPLENFGPRTGDRHSIQTAWSLEQILDYSGSSSPIIQQHWQGDAAGLW